MNGGKKVLNFSKEFAGSSGIQETLLCGFTLGSKGSGRDGESYLPDTPLLLRLALVTQNWILEFPDPVSIF